MAASATDDGLKSWLGSVGETGRIGEKHAVQEHLLHARSTLFAGGEVHLHLALLDPHWFPHSDLLAEPQSARNNKLLERILVGWTRRQ